jgi:hypothetical protein
MKTRVEVNFKQCKKIGEALRSFKLLPNKYCEKHKNLEDKEKEADFWFYVIAICHDTKSLKGTLDGKWLKGWDYLVTASRKKQSIDPNFFSASKMSEVTANELKTMLPTISRVEERAKLLNDCGKKLLENFDGKAMNIFKKSGGFLKRKDGNGILDVLSKFEAYNDPLQKKSLVLLHYIRDGGLLEIKDPENLKMPIDYHMMRVSLRTGIITILDKDLERKLKNREEAMPEDDLEIRSKAQEAYKIVSEVSGFDVADLDLIVWSLGRSCCDWRHDPICSSGKCSFSENCTLIKNVEIDCKGMCPLDGVCFGGKDENFRKFFETNIVTSYY